MYMRYEDPKRGGPSHRIFHEDKTMLAIMLLAVSEGDGILGAAVDAVVGSTPSSPIGLVVPRAEHLVNRPAVPIRAASCRQPSQQAIFSGEMRSTPLAHHGSRPLQRSILFLMT